ncbi:mannose-ethanolamine phosphotransferase gpi13 [Microbotryomycetes sp. JL221]|nr:mannose-ethanolamine phosphotransferase gpi13 [Microbotryomycetes sp. JL221]
MSSRRQPNSDPSTAISSIETNNDSTRRRQQHDPRREEQALAARIRDSFTTLPWLSPIALVATALATLSLMQLTGLYLFSKGFLLTRNSFNDINDCRLTRPPPFNDTLNPSCTMPATHSKLVLIVIDALRADFVLPTTTNEYYSNKLTLPNELTLQDSTKSFLSHFMADAPTTTLQRIKALTTGSLPTFVDAGSNFDAEQINEDTWLHQAKRHGKRLAMVGDDTWLRLFPTHSNNESVWQPKLTFGFDSFNVEDLDTVDKGVETHMLQLLDDTSTWDILIAHNLGLDHSGHRFGAQHSQTTRKLEQNDKLLRQVVDKLDDDTLLVVMGDHGMTNKGDHGGDSRDETDAALWIYSKTKRLTDPTWFTTPFDSIQHPAFDMFNMSTTTMMNNLHDQMFVNWSERSIPIKHRSISQIDIVPTLSLLLGLPVPFGNLGQPIPELFYRKSTLPSVPSSDSINDRGHQRQRQGMFGRANPTGDHDNLSALSTLVHSYMLTSSQLSNYLITYTNRQQQQQQHGSSNQIRKYLPELMFQLELAKTNFLSSFVPGQIKIEKEKQSLFKFWLFGLKTKFRLRSTWSTFNLNLMLLGLLIWFLTLLIGLRYVVSATKGQITTRQLVGQSIEGFVLSSWFIVALWFLGLLERIIKLTTFETNHVIISFVVFASQLNVLLTPVGSIGFLKAFGLDLDNFQILITLLPILAHNLLFASNSFTVHEDGFVLFALTSLLLVNLIKTLSTPELRLRTRLIGFNLLTIVCVKFMSINKVCREEQTLNCQTTFNQQSGSIESLVWIFISFISSWLLPNVLIKFLSLSKSNVGISKPFIQFLFRSLMLSSSSYWLFDWFVTSNIFKNQQQSTLLNLINLKTTFARISLMGSLLSSTIVWYWSPLCLEIKRQQIQNNQTNNNTETTTQVTFVGFANALGSTCLLFVTSLFVLLFLVQPPIGQVMIVTHLVALMSLLEMFDSERDVDHLYQLLSNETSLKQLLDGIDQNQENQVTPLSTVPSIDVHKGPNLNQLIIVYLLNHLSFFSMGHQATFNSIQWSTAFIGFNKVIKFISPLLVIVNTLGSSTILTSVCLPLFVFWNLKPNLKNQSPLFVTRDLLTCLIKFWLMESLNGLSISFFSMWFKRHLFVWKVFAPRFMLSGLRLIVLNFVLVLVSIFWCSRQVLLKAKITLGTTVAE